MTRDNVQNHTDTTLQIVIKEREILQPNINHKVGNSC